MGLCSNHWSEITQGNPNWRYVQNIEEKETYAVKKIQTHSPPAPNPLEHLPGCYYCILYQLSGILMENDILN